MSESLNIRDVPAPDTPWKEIARYAATFNGYEHFGKQHWRERAQSVSDAYFEHGELPEDVSDLRACLFCEFRMDRFTWDEEVMLSEPDVQGVRHFVADPDFERSPTQQYRLALIARVRELLSYRHQ